MFSYLYVFKEHYVDISCESSARQTIQMKYQVLQADDTHKKMPKFISLKYDKRKIRMLSATSLLSV